MTTKSKNVRDNIWNRLVVHDGNVGQRMEAMFFDDLRRSDEIRPAAFSRRSRTQRLLEHAANVLAGLL